MTHMYYGADAGGRWYYTASGVRDVEVDERVMRDGISHHPTVVFVKALNTRAWTSQRQGERPFVLYRRCVQPRCMPVHDGDYTTHVH